jgi:chromosome partitioning protein
MMITVAGFKGGVGKAPTAIHLAAYFAQTSDKTLLVDGDPNRSSLSWAKRGTLPFPVCDLMAAAKASRKMPPKNASVKPPESDPTQTTFRWEPTFP